MRRAIVLALLIGGCGGVVPPRPVPTPTATPPPTTTTTTSSSTTTTTTTTTTLPPVQACDNPKPGPVARMEVKIHIQGPNWTTIDATALVGQRGGDPTDCPRDHAYCALIGFTDNRGYCPPRVEGSPERGACDKAVTGGGIRWNWNNVPVTCWVGDIVITCPRGDDGTGAPEGTQMHEGGWMLQVRPWLKGTARACSRFMSGCREECGEVTIP